MKSTPINTSTVLITLVHISDFVLNNLNDDIFIFAEKEAIYRGSI